MTRMYPYGTTFEVPNEATEVLLEMPRRVLSRCYHKLQASGIEILTSRINQTASVMLQRRSINNSRICFSTSSRPLLGVEVLSAHSRSILFCLLEPNTVLVNIRLTHEVSFNYLRFGGWRHYRSIVNHQHHCIDKSVACSHEVFQPSMTLGQISPPNPLPSTESTYNPLWAGSLSFALYLSYLPRRVSTWS